MLGNSLVEDPSSRGAGDPWETGLGLDPWIKGGGLDPSSLLAGIDGFSVMSDDPR